MCRSPIDQMQEQLLETAQALKLSPKQSVLWGAYQTSVGALMADQIRREVFAPPQRTALQQIDAKVDVVRNRLAAIEEIGERARALYRSLDAEQKKSPTSASAARCRRCIRASSVAAATPDAPESVAGAGRAVAGQAVAAADAVVRAPVAESEEWAAVSAATERAGRCCREARHDGRASPRATKRPRPAPAALRSPAN